eukprot:scaffold26970_cov104-Isochrysis_galbana.AAC.3
MTADAPSAHHSRDGALLAVKLMASPAASLPSARSDLVGASSRDGRSSTPARSARERGRSRFFSHWGSVAAFITTDRRQAPRPPNWTAADSASTTFSAAAPGAIDRSTGGRQARRVPRETLAHSVWLRQPRSTCAPGTADDSAAAVASPIPLVPPVTRIYWGDRRPAVLFRALAAAATEAARCSGWRPPVASPTASGGALSLVRRGGAGPPPRPAPGPKSPRAPSMSACSALSLRRPSGPKSASGLSCLLAYPEERGEEGGSSESRVSRGVLVRVGTERECHHPHQHTTPASYAHPHQHTHPPPMGPTAAHAPWYAPLACVPRLWIPSSIHLSIWRSTPGKCHGVPAERCLGCRCESSHMQIHEAMSTAPRCAHVLAFVLSIAPPSCSICKKQSARGSTFLSKGSGDSRSVCSSIRPKPVAPTDANTNADRHQTLICVTPPIRASSSRPCGCMKSPDRTMLSTGTWAASSGESSRIRCHPNINTSPESDSPEMDAPEMDSPESDSPETDAPEMGSPKLVSSESGPPEMDAPELLCSELNFPNMDPPNTDSPRMDPFGRDPAGCSVGGESVGWVSVGSAPAGGVCVANCTPSWRRMRPPALASAARFCRLYPGTVKRPPSPAACKERLAIRSKTPRPRPDATQSAAGPS